MGQYQAILEPDRQPVGIRLNRAWTEYELPIVNLRIEQLSSPSVAAAIATVLS